MRNSLTSPKYYETDYSPPPPLGKAQGDLYSRCEPSKPLTGDVTTKTVSSAYSLSFSICLVPINKN